MNVKNISGMKFCRLTALSPTQQRDNGKVVWNCACECGVTINVNTARLVSGNVKSCGCLKAEGNRTMHGSARKGIRSDEYKIWMQMNSRCNNANSHAYKWYGARGIKVCDRWKDFNSFLDDVGKRPSSDHSIDRINPNLGYSPDNCRWATMKEQQRNRTNNKIFEAFGVVATAAEHCETHGISSSTLHARMSRGMTAEEALTWKRYARKQCQRDD